jgi:RNA methyltransferase, TrmH family
MIPNLMLTSSKNPLLQSIRRAAGTGRPTDEGLIVVEGPHLVEEALRSPWTIEQIFTTTKSSSVHGRLLSRIGAELRDVELIEVESRAFASVASTETTQELLALVRPKIWSFSHLMKTDALVVVLDGIQDPGNAGTIVRSAEAFGATGVALLKGCVHVANGKFLRATAGSIFRMPFVDSRAASEFIREARQASLFSYSLSAHAPASLLAANLRQGCALIVGSEGAGVSAELLSDSQEISIPTQQVESLNAAIACSIALFEAQRQRTGL